MKQAIKWAVACGFTLACGCTPTISSAQSQEPRGVPPELITSDAYKPYRAVLLEVYGEKKPVKRRHRRGSPPVESPSR